jgi:hypothetical protein
MSEAPGTVADFGGRQVKAIGDARPRRAAGRLVDDDIARLCCAGDFARHPERFVRSP